MNWVSLKESRLYSACLLPRRISGVKKEGKGGYGLALRRDGAGGKEKGKIALTFASIEKKGGEKEALSQTKGGKKKEGKEKIVSRSHWREGEKSAASRRKTRGEKEEKKEGKKRKTASW